MVYLDYMRKKWDNAEYQKAINIINNRRISLRPENEIIKEVAKQLDRSIYSVIKKLSSEGFKEEWEKWVVEYSRNHTYKETADRVGMSVSGVEKVVQRTKIKMPYMANKHENKSAKELVTLMRSSYLPSYEVAQFLTKSSSKPHKLFDKSFGTGGRWVHGMLRDDYWDLYNKPPEVAVKSNWKVGPNKKDAILVPWTSIPEHELMGKYIEVLSNYQMWLYDAESKEEATEILKILKEKPIMKKEDVDKNELKLKTIEAHNAFCEIKKYIVSITTESHRKNRYRFNN